MNNEADAYLNSVVANGPQDEALQTVVYHLKAHLDRCYTAIALLDRTLPNLDINSKQQLDNAKKACAAIFELLDNQVNDIFIPRLRKNHQE